LAAGCQRQTTQRVARDAVQQPRGSKWRDAGDHQLWQSPVVQADGVSEWGSVAFDVLHRPPVLPHLGAQHIEVILRRRLRVVAHPAHRSRTFLSCLEPAFPSGPTTTSECQNRTVSTAGPVNGRVSNWFAEYPPPSPALPGDRDADVCMVGAGYTGLWTAYYLKRADPSLRIAVIDARFAGFGAAGRNRGWLSGRGHREPHT